MRGVTLFLILVAVFFAGCTATRNTWKKIRDWEMRKNQEEVFYQTKEILKNAISEDQLKRCQYNFDLPIPKTIELTKKEMVERARIEQLRYLEKVATSQKITVEEARQKLEKHLYNPENVRGLFDSDTNTVYYESWNWDVLKHEYIHYFNQVSSIELPMLTKKFKGVSKTCLDEALAYMSVYASKKEKEAKFWKRKYQEAMRKNRR